MDELIAGEEWKAMDVSGTDWRDGRHDRAVAAAKLRIPDVRGRPVELRVLRHDGTPASNQVFRVVQTRGDFEFGDQMWAYDRMLRSGQARGDRGVYWLARLAEALTAANALCYWTERPENDGPKTEDLQGRPVNEHFFDSVEAALGAGLTVKGHPLFWSIPKCVPEWVKRYDYPTQMKFAEVRVRNLVARGRGRVKIWDAVNEPMWEPAFKNLSQRHWPHLDPITEIADYVEPVLRWCRQEDPDALFLVNDYGMELDPPSGPPKDRDGRPVTAALQRRRLIELIRELQHRGMPPDGIGLQSHTGGWISAADQQMLYDVMSQTQIPIHVTEFWASVKHLTNAGVPEAEAKQAQAAYVADYLTVAFAHPNVASFFFWGFMGTAVPFRNDTTSSHSLSPVFHTVRDLVKKQWRTDAQVTTDASGVARFHAFYGSHSLRHPLPGGAEVGSRFEVDRDNLTPLTVRLRT